MTKVIIVGTGAQAKHVINTLSFQEKFHIEGLIEPFPGERKEKLASLLGKPVLGDLNDLEKYSADEFSLVAGIGDNELKEKHTLPLLEKGYNFINCIHHTAMIAPSAKLGTGLIINAYSVIQPLATIGNFVVIHAGVVVEHDNILEDYVNLAPGVTLSGWVHVKRGATIFTGVSVIPCKKIGSYSVVNAGCVIVEDVPDNCVANEVPGRRMVYPKSWKENGADE